MMSEWLNGAGQGWIGLKQAVWWPHAPLYVLGVVLVYALYRRQVTIQRKCFHTRLLSAGKETGRSVIWGIAIGLIVSLLMLLSGARLDAGAVLWLWGFALLGILLRARFFCMAYAAGIIGVLNGLTIFLPEFGEWMASYPITAPVTTVHVPSLLLLIAILHGFEALSMKIASLRSASPLYVRGKRGKTVGAFQLQRFFPIPVFLLVPAATVTGIDPGLPLLFGLEAGAAGWSFLFVPLVIGYGERTETLTPAEKGSKLSLRLSLYGLAVLVLAFVAEWIPITTVFCALLAVALHEVVRYLGVHEERTNPPRYAADADGLKLLGTLPGSPAEEMGLKTGEVVVRVNGIRVHDRDRLHLALKENSAFCKLEVINLAGETKFVQRPIFAGDHHMLGLLPVPDPNSQLGIDRREKPAWSGWIALADDTFTADETSTAETVTAESSIAKPSAAEISTAEPEVAAAETEAEEKAAAGETASSRTPSSETVADAKTAVAKGANASAVASPSEKTAESADDLAALIKLIGETSKSE